MNFCTYFDSYYLCKGLALYHSLVNVTSDFHLYIMAFDKEAYDRLQSFGLENMTVELLDDFETEELLAVKPTRTRGEYCWTCGPSVILHFMEKYNLESITYLDSDLYFVNDPHIIQDEIADASVAITEQGISKQHSEVYGKYCVQYMYFRNDAQGREVLGWWKDRCIEWCFCRIEKGRFGDQKYLDSFPKLWDNICVIKNLGAGIAPWNDFRYKLTKDSVQYDGVTYPAVFVHLHAFAMNIDGELLHLHNQHYRLSAEAKACFYIPYGKLTAMVLEKYFGIKTSEIKITGISRMMAFNHWVRGKVRGFALFRWIYYNLFSQKYKGHGTKITGKS